MIARLFVVLPFALSVPAETQFNVYESEWSHYRVRLFPPTRRSQAGANNDRFEIEVDGLPAIQSDVLQIDFMKEHFDRSAKTPSELERTDCDPPHEVINEILEWFLLRLRHVTRAANIRPLNLFDTEWRLVYLNDDGSELPKEKGLVPSRGASVASISWIVLTNTIWDSVHTLPPDYSAPPWEGLLLDASLPGASIGNSIVLAATALEVFIAHVLDALAASAPISSELWSWINNRSDHTRKPSVEEQYDVLLRILSGHSLKEEKELWQAFMNLKTARNSFVHRGIARVGKSGDIADAAAAKSFVSTALAIIEKIRIWIPEQHHWKQYSHKFKVVASVQLVG
jgi:hypothetical protein